jgi:hypothetical protein
LTAARRPAFRRGPRWLVRIFRKPIVLRNTARAELVSRQAAVGFGVVAVPMSVKIGDDSGPPPPEMRSTLSAALISMP